MRKAKWYVVRFVDDGFDEIVSTHRTRKTADKAAVALRRGVREWNREYPGQLKSFLVTNELP